MKNLLNGYSLTIIGILLTISSCGLNEEMIEPIDPMQPVETYPSLKVVNETRNEFSIASVNLLGYEFSNLDIVNGSSQTFALDKGMSGGYSDINIIVGYRIYTRNGGHPTIKVDFKKGETSTITLKGCSGKEGCPGIYIE